MSKWSSAHNKTKVLEKTFDKLNFGRTRMNVSVRDTWRSQSHPEAEKDSQRNMNLKKEKKKEIWTCKQRAGICVFVNETGRIKQL